MRRDGRFGGRLAGLGTGSARSALHAAAQWRRIGWIAMLAHVALCAVTTVHAADGDFVWAKQMGGSANENGHSVVVDSSGNVYTTGFFTDTVDFDPGAGTANLTAVAAGVDIFVSKLDSSGAFVWARQMGGSNTEEGYSVAVDASGNVYTSGRFLGTADFDPGAGTTNLTAVGSDDIFVTKLDSAGNLVWAKQMGGSGSEAGNSIAVDASGNVYMTGSFTGTVDFDPGAATVNLTAVGSLDIFVTKQDSSGNLVWARQMGGSSSERGSSIAVDLSANIYTTGFFTGTADFDPGAGTANLTAVGSNDIFVSKLDSSGAFVWARQMGGSNSEDGYSVAADASGNVYTSGHFVGTVDFDPGAGTTNLTAVGADDIFVTKLDSAGNLVWAKQMGGSGNEAGNSIAVDISGNVYMTGDFNGTVDFDPGAATVNLTTVGTDIFVTKQDSSGNLVWALQMGGAFFNRGTSIAVDVSGNVYATGLFGGTVDFDPGAGISNLTAIGGNDIFVAKLSGPPVPSVPIITGPNAGADYSTSATTPVVISGTCDATTTAIYVNGSASGVTYTSGDTTWSYTSGTLSNGANLFSVTALNGFGESAADTITITVAPPSVLSIVRADANPSSAATVNFTVTFSSAVTGVDIADFALTTTGLGGASVVSVSADSGAARTVTVSTGNGDGTIRLDVVDDDTIVDALSVPLGGSGAGNGDYSAGEVYTIDKTYAYSSQFGTSGSGDGQLSSPDGISVTSAGDLYVSDAGNNRIQEFTSAGTYVTKWGSSGSGASQFSSPRGNTVDASVNVYVADVGNNRVQVFTSSGTYVTQWGGAGSGNGQFVGPHDVAVDSLGAVYVADLNNNRIQKFTSTGTYVTQWGGVGSGDGQFSTPRGVAVDSSNNVYVADTGNNRIQKFTSTGTFVTKWGTSGSGDGQFNTPYGLTVDPSGKVIVADTGNNRFQVFTSTGTFVKSRGTLGSGDGQLNFPTAVDSDSAGNVYVADTGNDRIQKFTGDPATAAVSIARAAANPSNASSVTFTVTFNNAVTGVDTGDFTLTTTGVAGASIISVSTDSGFTRTVTVNTGSGNGTIRLDVVDDDSILDSQSDRLGGTGVGNGDFTGGEVYTIDKVVPSVVISSLVSSPTNDSPIAVTVTFSEPMTGFVAGDITAGNGTVSNFAGSGDTYTFDLTPSGQGAVTADIAAGACTDTAGNGNTAATQFSRVYDSVLPGVSLSTTASDPTNTSPIPVTVTFTEPVTGLDGGDFVLGNGTVNNFAGSGANYTFDLVPSGNGTVTVDLQAGVAADAAGNPNTAAAQLAREYDNVDPTVSITTTATNPTNTSPIPVTVTFSKNVTGFATGDITVTNGTKSNFVAVTQKIYTFDLTPSGQGSVDADVAAAVCTSTAGSPNQAGSFSITYDSVGPNVTLATTASSPTNVTPIPVTVTFTEAVADFVSTEVVAINGTIANFIGSGTNYSFDLVPSGAGLVSANVAAGEAHDAAGNGSNVSNTVSRTFDNVLPIIALLGSDPVQVNQYAAYADAGATASDNTDGDITANIVADTSNVNSNIVGFYTVTYDVTDAAGNDAVQATRTVEVVANAAGLPVNPWLIVISIAFSALVVFRSRMRRNRLQE